ncbi:MAG: TIGR01548 family HAD-type hydrolase [Myxococcales bacterium]|jgi:HAD superfamily hydrolase (TIGR01548 family)|nr:TIGR01548 family HAD-type hydrolase [Myxococcales bacterium]
MTKRQALIFDIDDTLVDVSESYRQATVATAAHFGIALTFDDITRARVQGNANNDWVLTRDMMAHRGRTVDLAEVTRVFEDFYQGTPSTPGMRLKETLLLARDVLHQLAQRYPLGVVTGRPRTDADNFIAAHDLHGLFRVMITMEDAPLKPSPVPVRMALEQLGIQTALFFGDTPDDMRAAVGAGIEAIGVIAPADDPAVARAALLAAGASHVLTHIRHIDEVLP